jgi:adenylate cyclase class IV
MEIEIKAKVKDFKPIKQKLIKMGVKRIKKVH